MGVLASVSMCVRVRVCVLIYSISMTLSIVDYSSCMTGAYLTTYTRASITLHASPSSSPSSSSPSPSIVAVVRIDPVGYYRHDAVSPTVVVQQRHANTAAAAAASTHAAAAVRDSLIIHDCIPRLRY